MTELDAEPKIVLVGYAVPKQSFYEVVKHDAYPQMQGTKHMWRIIRGIEASAPRSLDLIGAVPASDYPKNPKIFFGFQRWRHNSNAVDVVVPFINVIFLKHLTRFFSTFFLLCGWLFLHRKVKNRHVLIYAMHSPYVFASVLSKILFQAKLTLIVPDLPDFMYVGIRIGIIRRIGKRIDASLMRVVLKRMNGLIVLTKQCGQELGSAEIPTLVVEGSVSLDELQSLKKSSNASTNKKKVVMFTGGLLDLDILLNAFKLIDRSDIYLHVTGRGPMERKIIDASKNDHRIAYFGLLSKDALLERMSEATIFVSVRSAKTPYIQYSFPSKLLEYMGTGRPTISTVLPGIPDEYHNYLYLLAEESPEALARLLVQLCDKPPGELDDFGARARDFVRTKKNYRVQGKRIYDFVKAL